MVSAFLLMVAFRRGYLILNKLWNQKFFYKHDAKLGEGIHWDKIKKTNLVR